MRTTSSSRRRALQTAAGLLAAVATLSGCSGCSGPASGLEPAVGHVPGQDIVAEAARVKATPVISALERYKAAKGHYPEKLAELVPEFAPSVPGDEVVGTTWHYQPKGNSFELGFRYVVFGVNECVYQPAEGKWQCTGAI